ncbi:MAG TPA: TonB-dependent receptor plug domain-containing protein [Terracidiphilus sp.]|jgi:iron complex outermembrane receptor protein/vitamin B12 transporter|nr:TonB-dependent receptor plug domain-containing protein [Terracidiphilus sp.]
MFQFSSLRFLRWTSSLIFAFTTIALAAPSTNLRGTVSDATGAVISNAKVELLEHGIPVASVVTNPKGQFIIAWSPGTASRLRVSASGFSSLERSIEAPSDSRELTEDIVLPIASLSEQITVTSTGSPTPQAQLGAAVTVLNPDEYVGTRDIQEGLRFVPGINVTETGQAGGTTSVFIRGGGSDANKVLIDGVPMNDIGGAVEFANIASVAVGQVEVLRGPNSALYGSDALAGVISLTTARGSTPLPLLTYQAGGGNFGTYHQESSVGGRFKKLDYFSDYSRFDSSNANPDDEYHNGTLAGNLGWEFSPASSLRATVHHDRVASGQPGAIQLFGIPSDAEQANEDAYFGVTWDDRTTASWHNLLRYGGLRLRSQFAQFAPTGTPESGYTLGAPVTIQGANGYTVSGQALESNDGPPYPYTYPGSTDKDFVYAQSDYRFNPHILGLVAFRYEDERGYSGGPASSIERGNYSYTFQLQGDILNRLFYTVGGGIEDNGLFGLAGTPRASLAWQVARERTGKIFTGTKLRASFGKGIKEPAVFDQLDSLYPLLASLPGGSQLISQYHVSAIGPENSRTYDGGVDQLLLNGRSRLSLTLFHNEFTNGIEYITQQGLIDLGVPSAIADAAAFGATVNSLAYRAQGIETEIEYQVTRDVFARAGYTYVDAGIQHSFTSDAIGPSFNPDFPTVPIGIFSPLIGARPFRVPPHAGYFEAGYRHSRLFASLRGTLVGSRDDSDFLTDSNFGNTLLLPNRNLDGAYQRLDLTSSYQADRHIAVEGDFQNLLSEHYSEAFGYPSLPFTFRLGMKFSLGGESWFGK